MVGDRVILQGFEAWQNAWPWLLAAEARVSTWERLDPVRRAKLLMALLALLLVGMALMALVMVGARYVRRLARNRTSAGRAREDDWYQKPLIPRDAGDPDPPRDPSDGGAA